MCVCVCVCVCVPSLESPADCKDFFSSFFIWPYCFCSWHVLYSTSGVRKKLIYINRSLSTSTHASIGKILSLFLRLILLVQEFFRVFLSHLDDL